jgi:hypothetical protein
MTTEQEKAIERCKQIIKDNKEIIKEARKNGDINTIQLTASLDNDSLAIEIVLSMLQEKDKEIEKYKYLYQKTLDNTIQADRENIKLKKQIDLMADFIFQNIDVEEDICNSAYIKCKQETGQDITCINCIKQYFERKAKE